MSGGEVTRREKAVWRNMASHVKGKNFKGPKNGNLVTLPGPVSWWPEDYDVEGNGFAPDADAENAWLAYILVTEDFTVANSAAFFSKTAGFCRL